MVGSDGATHQGVFDMTFMRSIPNMVVAAPMDEIELRNMMYTAQLEKYGPFSIRYPRGPGRLTDWRKPFREIRPGTARKLADGNDLAILSIGVTGNLVNDALEHFRLTNLSIAHYDMRYVKPLDEETLHMIFKKFNKIITVEDGAIIGGFGSSILEFMSDNSYAAEVKRLGVHKRNNTKNAVLTPTALFRPFVQWFKGMYFSRLADFNYRYREVPGIFFEDLANLAAFHKSLNFSIQSTHIKNIRE